MASLFIEDGTIVRVTYQYEGDRDYRADGRRLAWDRPMAMLVDEGTARTCEVLTAALRDGLQTPIVGERTWGIGNLHELLPLGNGDGVFLAVGRFLSPTGKDWNAVGIEPDLQIVGDAVDEEDPQQRRAIDYLRGLAASERQEAA